MMTYVQALEVAINAVADEEVKERLTALSASLAKRNSKKSNSPTKRQKENVEVMETIVEVLASCEEPVTVSELQKDERLAEFSNQRLSALLKKLVDEKKVVSDVTSIVQLSCSFYCYLFYVVDVHVFSRLVV